MIKRFGLFCTLFWILVSSLHAQTRVEQNYTCESALPFCTGTQYAFPAAVNAGVGQPGPCYDCLINTPNPAWYFLRIADPGNLIIKLQSEPPRDIDFCCWGPFDSTRVCDQLTCDKVVSCNYGGSSTKYCTIPNGQTGEYYMVVITNISNLPCNIIFTQTGGTGSTDCSIMPPPCSNNSPVCAGQTLQFTATTVLSASYYWTGPDGFTSGSQNPTIYNAQYVNSGDYYLHLIINGQPGTDSVKCPAYVYDPVPDAGKDTIIPTGNSITLHCDVTQSSGSCSYHWEPAALLVDPDIASPTTVDLFNTTLFTVTVTDDSAGCQGQDYITVYMSNGELSVNPVARPPTICYGGTTELFSNSSGGSGFYSYLWTGPGTFTSSLPDITVQPPVTSTYYILLNDGFSTVTDSITVYVEPLPLANPGSNQTIPYGTYTYLDGSAAGGSGDYFYSWTPVVKLLNPNVQKPQTVNLNATTVYSLVVTDNNTTCVSTNFANVDVYVTGGPLTVNPVATPKKICPGDTTQLHAAAGGGNAGYYQYEWSSVPPGFTSSEANPFVHPEETTTYTVKVFDGFNTANGSVTVSQFQKPVVSLGPPDTTVCIYELMKIDAENPGCTYLWSNGATTRIVTVKSAGIVPESQNYFVKVTNPDKCHSTDDITVNFDYSACTGFSQPGPDQTLIFYPNPSDGIFLIEQPGSVEVIEVKIMDILGKPVRKIHLQKNISGKNTERIDLTDLPPGIYLAEIVSGSHVSIEKLIVK